MSDATLSRLLSQYKRVAEVSHNLASMLELEPLLKGIMEVAVDLVEAEEASVLLYDQHSHRLYFETATNADSSPLLQKLFIPEESIAGWVALNLTPQIINNVQQDERHYNDIDKKINFSSRSMIAVPLIAKQKLIGVLELMNKKEGMFDTEDQEILLALAAQAAVAIENSRLFQQSDLIAEFVHELRTPMSSIFTASYLLQRPEIATEQRMRMAQTIHNETQRLNELASIFLDLASLESGRASLHPTHIQVRPLLEECLQVAQMKAAEKNIQVHLEMPDNLPELQADRDKIKQVVLNLLNNAVKYNCLNGQVWLRAWQKDALLCFSIQDTGVGIPPEQISKLFTRFFRASNVERSVSGTGLGLSISRRIVEMHNGEVQVESTLNVGTTFTVQLPLVQETY
jgi:signal transduction histidine kinase